MSFEEEPGRPRRKAKKLPTKKPAASHYVGYVDDEETPEMIMKKFEMLDKMMEASNKGLFKEPKVKVTKGRPKRDKEDYAFEKPLPQAPPAPQEPQGPDQILNEHQLALLFKMTSSFQVPTDGYIDSAFNSIYDPEDFQLSDDESNYFLAEDEFFGDQKAEGDKKSKKRKREGEAKVRKTKEKDLTGVGTYKPKMKLLSMELVGADGMYYTIKKKVKLVDPLAPTYIRIPSQVPLPRSWGRTVAPYTGLNHELRPDGVHCLETDILGFDLKSLGRKFQAAIIDPPWAPGAALPGLFSHVAQVPDTPQDHRPYLISPEQLYELRLDEVIEAGLLFIWTDKQHIAPCIKVASRWGFTYVENLVWITQQVSHMVMDESYAIFPKSKISLLIFKKGNGFALRHQRHPDVIFDYVRETKYLTVDKPKYAYTIAETLLPEACFSEESGGGRFLELWARKGTLRKGWTSIAQQLPPEPSFLLHGLDSIPLPDD